jgi:hypothetical protein
METLKMKKTIVYDTMKRQLNRTEREDLLDKKEFVEKVAAKLPSKVPDNSDGQNALFSQISSEVQIPQRMKAHFLGSIIRRLEAKDNPVFPEGC